MRNENLCRVLVFCLKIREWAVGSRNFRLRIREWCVGCRNFRLRIRESGARSRNLCVHQIRRPLPTKLFQKIYLFDKKLTNTCREKFCFAFEFGIIGVGSDESSNRAS